MSNKTMILVLDHDDDEAELDFELKFQGTLTVEQRYEMMFRRSLEISKMLEANGYKKPFEIIKRVE
ncbi:MAG: hypothetical protein KKF20_06740 [Bacteroidetes bacterium]|nr:hypothetical protein [Bacteroidota bacterium]MBU1422854.1 hypothetical protein [Bacteroidota bacterium]MBU2472088.1 hypothetical protein [Bacteroidota bacterium]MBU2636652.1 hypothetical protein [Bacteroidota bacterium]MDI6779364.1 hypothetical protein [Bacteroidota bacterium]